MKSLYIILLGLSMALVSCSPDSSRPIIPEDKMADILVDQYLIQSANTQRPVKENEKINFYYAHILEKYQYTEAEFDSSVAWYTSHMDVYDKVYEEVMRRLQAMEDSSLNVVSEAAKQ
jgi:hypothetical protein